MGTLANNRTQNIDTKEYFEHADFQFQKGRLVDSLDELLD